MNTKQIFEDVYQDFFGVEKEIKEETNLKENIDMKDIIEPLLRTSFKGGSGYDERYLCHDFLRFLQRKPDLIRGISFRFMSGTGKYGRIYARSNLSSEAGSFLT